MKMTLTVLCLLTTTLATAARLPRAADEAHDAYLDGNGKVVVEKVKEALHESENHPLIVSNMMGLLKAAKKNGLVDRIEPGFRLPKEVSYLTIETQRRYKSHQGKVTYALNASIGVRKPSELEEFQVIRFPDQVIFDKSKGIGEMYPEETTTESELWIGGPQSQRPVEEGLYLVNVKLKDQSMIRGYVILNDKNASASPVITTPTIDQKFSEKRPTIKWKPFQSPEMQESEYTRANLKIRHLEGSDHELIDVQLLDPKIGEFTVGDRSAARSYRGLDELEVGKYLMLITYREFEEFGDIAVKRASTTQVTFEITK